MCRTWTTFEFMCATTFDRKIYTLVRAGDENEAMFPPLVCLEVAVFGFLFDSLHLSNSYLKTQSSQTQFELFEKSFDLVINDLDVKCYKYVCKLIQLAMLGSNEKIIKFFGGLETFVEALRFV